MDNHVFAWSITDGTNTTFVGLGDAARVPAVTSNQGTPMQFGGTVSVLRIWANGAPGAGKSFVITLQVAPSSTPQTYSDTTMVLTLADANDAAVTTANPYTFVAGDTLRLKIVPTNAPSLSQPYAIAALVATSGAVSVIPGHSAAAISNSATRYMNPSGGGASGTEANVRGVVKAPGTIKNLAAECAVAPGAGKSRSFTLMLNGVATSLTCTVSGTNVQASDTSNTVAVVKGDLVTMRSTPSGTPASSNVGWSMEFDPTTNGEQILLSGGGTNSNSATRYGSLGVGRDGSASEGEKSLICANCTIVDWGGTMNVAAGTGNSWTWTVRVNGSNTSGAYTISDAETSDESTVDPAVVAGDRVNYEQVPVSLPSGTISARGCVLYIAPAAAGGARLVGGGLVHRGRLLNSRLAGSRRSA